MKKYNLNPRYFPYFHHKSVWGRIIQIFAAPRTLSDSVNNVMSYERAMDFIPKENRIIAVTLSKIVSTTKNNKKVIHPCMPCILSFFNKGILFIGTKQYRNFTKSIVNIHQSPQAYVFSGNNGYLKKKDILKIDIKRINSKKKLSFYNIVLNIYMKNYVITLHSLKPNNFYDRNVNFISLNKFFNLLRKYQVR